ncbi:hypothetical protein Agub_g15367, partial [Astrephomene gubernaculifera]
MGLLDYVGEDVTSTSVLVLLAVLVRVLTGLSSYSGAGDPPKYGDYEAQRHWMELTVNLPVREWYTDSPVNNGSYWPLDYPPLSGYQSWLCGLLVRSVEPAAVALLSSHGWESPASKSAMRATVLAADLLVYIPACLFAVHVFYGSSSPGFRSGRQDTASGRGAAATAAAQARRRRRSRALALFALLFNPAVLLIDHGHFQYNGISLGLTLAAAAAIAAGSGAAAGEGGEGGEGGGGEAPGAEEEEDAAGAAAAGAKEQQGQGQQRERRWLVLLGAVLYCLALNHKQMSLFFAPAFFAHLLGWALHGRGRRGAADRAAAVAQLGATVLASFAVCWAPYLGSVSQAAQVLARIFPVRRGLFEDYVANWWCASSLGPLKWKTRFTGAVLLRAAAGATLAAAAPAMTHQILGRGGAGAGAGGPTRWGLLRCMANSGFAFFMFSYQVHEKSILLPLLPLSLLAGRHPGLAAWLPLLAALSMFP